MKSVTVSCAENAFQIQTASGCTVDNLQQMQNEEGLLEYDSVSAPLRRQHDTSRLAQVRSVFFTSLVLYISSLVYSPATISVGPFDGGS